MARQETGCTDKVWTVYLLICGTRTYVGCTTDVKRRLRQHNGEIRGGARATRKSGPNWQIAMYVSGFKNRSEACRWEALVKKRARGVGPRKAALWGLTAGVCPTGRTVFVVPKNLEGVCLIVDESDLNQEYRYPADEELIKNMKLIHGKNSRWARED